MIKQALLCLMLMMFLAGCINNDEPTADGNKVNIGDELPIFTVTSNEGIEYNNELLKGHIGVILFFYTPCSDCKQALPIVNEVFEQYKTNQQVRWICIGRSESIIDVASYWDSNHFTMPYSAQSDRSIYNLFANSGIPRIYITNPQGVVVALYDDSSPLDKQEFENTLSSIYSSYFTF